MSECGRCQARTKNQFGLCDVCIGKMLRNQMRESMPDWMREVVDDGIENMRPLRSSKAWKRHPEFDGNELVRENEKLRSELDDARMEIDRLKRFVLTLQHLVNQIRSLHTMPTESGIDQKMLKKLISLTHPDKHGNSKISNEVTTYLLSLRGDN